MTMMTEPIRILMGSDFHFGNPDVNQEEMADAFAEVIFPLLAETDIFFINGDFFDTLVIFDNHGFDPIHDTIMGLFTLCERHRVILRVLQGTWTHDRGQLKRFSTFYRNGGFTFDFKLFETIDLESITVRDRDLRIMYVPDDLPFTTADKSSDAVLVTIREKMARVGWDYVDYGCMHGFFDFTFPKGVKQDKVVVYRHTQFDFVRKMINVGHVHQNRTEGAVISNGSFDRHCFGDEDPKGCVKVFDYPDHYTAQFVENKNAAVYDTIDFKKDDTTEIIRARIDDHLAKIDSKRKISIRCRLESSEHKEAIKEWMKDKYPHIRRMIKIKTDTDDRPMMIPNSVLFTPVEKRISPTPKTISSFIRSYIEEDYVLSIEKIDFYLEPVNEKL